MCLLMFSACLCYATLGEVRRFTRVLAPTPPEVTRDLIVRNASDSLGRRASFRILLFTDEFRWRLNSFDALENGSAEPLFTPEMKAALERRRGNHLRRRQLGGDPAGRVVRRGAGARGASRGPPGGTDCDLGAGGAVEGHSRQEAQRRPSRVDRLRRDTSDQRRVVIILVLDHDSGTNIDQALRQAMSNESDRAPIFETLLTAYSLTTGSDFTWVP